MSYQRSSQNIFYDPADSLIGHGRAGRAEVSSILQNDTVNGEKAEVHAKRRIGIFGSVRSLIASRFSKKNATEGRRLRSQSNKENISDEKNAPELPLMSSGSRQSLSAAYLHSVPCARTSDTGYYFFVNQTAAYDGGSGIVVRKNIDVSSNSGGTKDTEFFFACHPTNPNRGKFIYFFGTSDR